MLLLYYYISLPQGNQLRKARRTKNWSYRCVWDCEWKNV